MDRMLVVVFDNESKAYEGKKALLQLDGEGSIAAYGYAVVAKNSDGTTSVKQGDDSGPLDVKSSKGGGKRCAYAKVPQARKHAYQAC